MRWHPHANTFAQCPPRYHNHSSNGYRQPHIQICGPLVYHHFELPQNYTTSTNMQQALPPSMWYASLPHIFIRVCAIDQHNSIQHAWWVWWAMKSRRDIVVGSYTQPKSRISCWYHWQRPKPVSNLMNNKTSFVHVGMWMMTYASLFVVPLRVDSSSVKCHQTFL
jgi:hypothetical protein